MINENNRPKERWATPILVVHGDVVQITKEQALPPKQFGASDGIVESATSIHFIS